MHSSRKERKSGGFSEKSGERMLKFSVSRSRLGGHSLKGEREKMRKEKREKERERRK